MSFKDFRPLFNYYATILGRLGYILSYFSLKDLELHHWLLYSLKYILREGVKPPALVTFSLSLLLMAVPRYFRIAGRQCFQETITPTETGHPKK